MMIVKQFLLAVSFLTRVPVPAGLMRDGEGSDNGKALRLSGAVWAFPLVGMLVGAFAAVVLLVGDQLGLPPVLCCLAALAAGVIATGALHEDGLGDFCDGLGVTGKGRIFKVMRDSQSGSYGVLGLIFSLAWRAAALAAIFARDTGVDGHDGAGMAAMALLLMHVGARGIMAGLLLLPLADVQGLAHVAREGGAASGVAVVVAVGITAGLFLWMLAPAAALAALLSAALAAGLIALIAVRRVGGMTGDVYGAAEQMAEMAIVAALVASW